MVLIKYVLVQLLLYEALDLDPSPVLSPVSVVNH